MISSFNSNRQKKVRFPVQELPNPDCIIKTQIKMTYIFPLIVEKLYLE